jgi:hypothetical protein
VAVLVPQHPARMKEHILGSAPRHGDHPANIVIKIPFCVAQEQSRNLQETIQFQNNEVRPIRSIVVHGFRCGIIIDSTKAPQQDVGH